MSRLDDHLTRGLERAARLADPSGVFERIDRRRARRHALRRVQAMSLAVVVIAGSVGGFVFLSKAFGPARTPGGEAPVRNGVLIVAMVDPSDHYDLYVVDPTTRDRRQLTTGPASDGSATVSPDGRTVAFDRVDDTGSGKGSGIYTIGIDGSDLRRIADAPATDLAWSPDGSRIAFERGAFGPNGIWIMKPDGSEPKLIPGTDTLDTGNPAWSPDGTSIAFEGGRIVGQGELIWDLYTIPVDATGPQDLHRLTDTPDRNEVLPSWSPDGTRIVFSQVAPRLSINSGGIAVMSADGGDIFFVTTGGPYDNNPSWSPDGSLIAFDRSSREALSVYTIRPDGTDLTRVVDGMDPAWQPLPPGVDSSPVQSPSPTNSGTVDLGFGYAVCDVSGAAGNFGGNAPSMYLATKLTDVGECPAPGDPAFRVLGLDTDGDGKIDASFGPLECRPSCHIFGVPDINGDGWAELAIVQGVRGPTDSVQIYTVVASDQPALIPWSVDGRDLRIAWDESEDTPAGAFCQHSGQYDLAVWSASANPDGTYDVLEDFYRFDGTEVHLVSHRHDENLLPSKIAPGGGESLCRVPVLP